MLKLPSADELDQQIEGGRYSSVIESLEGRGLENLPSKLIERYFIALRRSYQLTKAQSKIEWFLGREATDTLGRLLGLKELATCKWMLGKYDETEKLLSQVMESLQTAEISEEEARKLDVQINLIKGVLNGVRGNYLKSLEFHFDILDKFTDVEHKSDLAAIVHNNIGVYFLSQGDYTSALKHLQLSLNIQRKTQNKRSLAYILLNMGIINHAMGEFDLSEENFLTSKEIWSELKSDAELSSVFFELALLYLSKGEGEKAGECLEMIEGLQNSEKMQVLHFRKDLLKAILLKKGKRLHTKFSAIPLLESLVSGELVDARLMIIAMNHYCELLLLELEATSSNEVLDTINDLLANMVKISREQYLHTSLVQTLILQSKLEMVQNNLERSTDLLKSAENFARQKGMEVLFKQVESQIYRIQELIFEWQDNLSLNATFAQKIEQTQILEYLRSVQSIVK